MATTCRLKRRARAGVLGLSLSLGLTLGLGACVSVLPEPETPEALYRIPAPAEIVTLDETVSIREPDAPRLFAGRAVASEDGAGALRLISGVEWADRATRLLRSAVMDGISATGEGGAITVDDAARADQELDWRVIDFHLRGDEAVCRLSVALYDVSARNVMARQVIERSVPVTGRGNGARMAAMTRVGQDCASGVAAFVRDAQAAG